MSAGPSVAFEDLRPGDHIRVTQRIKVGLKAWTNSVDGRVKRTERRRNGLHVFRSNDDFAFQDLIVLHKDGDASEVTTITLDEFAGVERLP